MRLVSNIESKSLNYTYLNIIEMFNKLDKKIEHHRNPKFDRNIDLKKIHRFTGKTAEINFGHTATVIDNGRHQQKLILATWPRGHTAA